MASAQTFLSLDRFQTLDQADKPYLEYWFGKAVPKESNTLLHGAVETIVATMIGQRGWTSALEVRLKLSAHAQPIPDVIADAHAIRGLYPTEPFGLCVEVLSPGEDVRKLFEKAAHYLDWKIANVWIIDPELRKAYMMTLESPAPLELDATRFLAAKSGGLDLTLPLSELFAEVDKVLAN